MKKKALTVILSLCVAMTMTACGGNAETTEVKETTAIAESTETNAQAEVETEEQTQEEAEEQSEDTEALNSAEADACYEAGRRSLYGLDGVEIDREEAYNNFLKAQELGKTDANFYLGVLADSYYNYPKRDYEQAKSYYEQSGDNPYAQIALGCLYAERKGVDWDMEKAEELFQSATDQGVVEGYYGLAMVARNEEDYETALEYYNKVVEEGKEQLYITNSMIGLGDMYEVVNGVEEDGGKAIEWYTKAADAGCAEGFYSIGCMYHYGMGVDWDYDKAMECYTKGADLGDTSSMINIGAMYANGLGVDQDGAKAIEWHTKAIEAGDVNGYAQIGMMYQQGNGVEQDLDKAIEWYTKGEDLGDLVSKYFLEQMQQEQ